MCSCASGGRGRTNSHTSSATYIDSLPIRPFTPIFRMKEWACDIDDGLSESSSRQSRPDKAIVQQPAAQIQRSRATVFTVRSSDSEGSQGADWNLRAGL